MLFRVSFWNDRADTEVFGKTVEAENECEAEEKFFDELEDENDYSDEFPVLVQEIKEEPIELDFENLFYKALNNLTDVNGGNLDSALYDMGIQFESETGKAIRKWFGWEDSNEEDEEFEVQFADDDDNIFEGGYYNSLEEAKEAALDGYHSDPDYLHFAVYDGDGDIVFCDDDLIEDEEDNHSELPWDYTKHFE